MRLELSVVNKAEHLAGPKSYIFQQPEKRAGNQTSNILIIDQRFLDGGFDTNARHRMAGFPICQEPWE
jgi:hypothetical protein